MDRVIARGRENSARHQLAVVNCESRRVAAQARWNGTTWMPLGDGLTGVQYRWDYRSVHALATFNGQLIAAGDLCAADGHPVEDMARWDGTRWKPVGDGPNGDILALTVHADQLIAGGDFTGAGGQSANYVAARSDTAWTPIGEGLHGAVNVLGIYNNELIAAGVAAWDGSTWEPFGTGIVGPGMR